MGGGTAGTELVPAVPSSSSSSKPRKSFHADPEVAAIAGVLAALGDLDEPAMRRVLDYVGLRLFTDPS